VAVDIINNHYVILRISSIHYIHIDDISSGVLHYARLCNTCYVIRVTLCIRLYGMVLRVWYYSVVLLAGYTMYHVVCCISHSVYLLTQYISVCYYYVVVV